jgi:predicted dehydrogenase
MKLLVCGIGSIGQRHYRNLQDLGHEVAIFRSGKNNDYNKPFVDAFFKEQNRTNRPVRVFHDLMEALEVFNPRGVFVTNPNSAHIDVALPAARASKHLFIEKPLSHGLQNLDQLQELSKKHSLVIMVGYNLRFHPLLQRMRELYTSGVIGRALAAHVEMGENIEDWHVWEDYRQSYGAQRSSGGGAVLCFSHEIDYLYWFFGKPTKVFSLGGKLTPLEGDAEDMVKALLEFPNGMVVSLHLDYWQRPPRRVFDLIGSNGKLSWDYYGGTLMLFSRLSGSQPERFSLPVPFERNDMFVTEVNDFIQAIEKQGESSIPLSQGREVLEIALEIKRMLNG